MKKDIEIINSLKGKSILYRDSNTKVFNSSEIEDVEIVSLDKNTKGYGLKFNNNYVIISKNDIPSLLKGEKIFLNKANKGKDIKIQINNKGMAKKKTTAKKSTGKKKPLTKKKSSSKSKAKPKAKKSTGKKSSKKRADTKRPSKKKPTKTKNKRSAHAIAMDKRRKAKKPGKRISKSGKVYYEYRENRSDKDRRKRI